MASGVVIVGLVTDSGEWDTLALPSLSPDKAKAMFRELRSTQSFAGVEYDEVRLYNQQGCKRRKFKGQGIVGSDLHLVESDVAGKGDSGDAAVVSNKGQLQVALGVEKAEFDVMWKADGRPERGSDGYVVSEFVDFLATAGS